IGRPGWDHRGLPCEPGCCLCQDIALLAQLPVLTPQTGQLPALGAGRALRSAAFIAIGLSHPAPDRLGSRFEFARQRLRCSPRSDQINHLSPELRRIGSVTLRHRWHLLLKWKGVHQTGSTPRRRSPNRSARPKEASIWSRLSGSSRTPTANVAEVKRSKASAEHERGPYGSPNLPSNQRCTRAWLR